MGPTQRQGTEFHSIGLLVVSWPNVDAIRLVEKEIYEKEVGRRRGGEMDRWKFSVAHPDFYLAD